MLLPVWQRSSDVHSSVPPSTADTERQEQAPCVYIFVPETSAELISLQTGLLKVSPVPSARSCVRDNNNYFWTKGSPLVNSETTRIYLLSGTKLNLSHKIFWQLLFDLDLIR